LRNGRRRTKNKSHKINQQITDAVAATFGSLSTQQKADTVRCIAEFAERVYAHKHGTIPPDEADGHSAAVAAEPDRRRSAEWHPLPRRAS
jgi:hypothetical protein